MAYRFKKSSINKSGLPPGTLVYRGKERQEEVKITVFNYSNDDYLEEQDISLEESLTYKEKAGIKWINIDGLHNIEVVKSLGEAFNIHSLVLEDILDTDHRPKVDCYDEFVYFIIKLFSYDATEEEIDIEQLSIILGDDFVLTFQEKEGDVFDNIRERIRNQSSRLRSSGSDYLAYVLLDVIVDNYFVVLDEIGEGLFLMEEDLLLEPSQDILPDIQQVKRKMIFLEKSVWPLKGILNNLLKGDNKLFKESTTLYLKDVNDHIEKAIDTIQTFRDIINGMMDTYLSNINNKMNEIMKVLTIISTIFIPLTFIAGIYGMNFRYMPELESKLGYPITLIVMSAIVIGMLVYFKKKKWL
ncbi:magnesium and cobalt transport protein CorA [Orenia metallireducens]|uniref:Magnesium transport protein CorA n=1 Tax=Orenia metallireducens TaxID=1413210 RepID=A0A1C0A765_9FIRM|nr:magnesium/cobalt transporter CorA [Orenia metallireducens]OCL26086.1 magnesium and cobalt transport protein CorA [Orenia metallireducens]